MDFKVTFLNPPFHKNYSRPQRSPAVTKSGTLYYPLWLASAASLAAEEGFEIDFIDAPADGCSLEEVIKRINDFSPEMVVLETSTPSIYNDVNTAAEIKKAVPKAFTLLVGTHVSALPEESLKLNDSVDAVAIGEFDDTVAETALALTKGGKLSKIKGLCFKESGKTIRTRERPPVRDLDALPFVSKIYKRFLDTGNYFNPNALYPMVTITTSRGCPYQCTFCVYPQTMMGNKLRIRSVSNVVDEIEYIVNNFRNVKALFFEDDTFTAIKKRCADISNEILRRGIDISWTANARADLDFKTMTIMKKAGCRCLCAGFESGSTHLLDNIKKKIKRDDMLRFMENARTAGILIHGCFMVGLPGETKETMNETLTLAKRLNPDTVQFYPIMVYPGTEAYRWYKERNLIATDDFSKWLTHGGLHNTVIATQELSSEELVNFCDYARRSFYLRPQYLFYKLRQTLNNREERKRNLKSAKTFIKYLMKGSDV